MLEVLVITISNPLIIGVYQDKILIKEYVSDGKTSDVLPLLFAEILEKYEIDKIAYVNTPGSFMAIKVAYIFLKSISLVKNIDLEAIDGFLFNNNSPIKALGKKYFIKQKDGIKVDFIENDCKISAFSLPKNIENINFKKEALPIYILPAV